MKTIPLDNPFGGPVYHEETLSSTMDAARELAARGAPHGTVLCADFQEAGRGRTRGRPWLAARGDNLLFTILLRYGLSVPSLLTLRAGLAVSRAVEAFAPPLAGLLRIKWPNDLLILLPSGARKTAGILAESDGSVLFTGIGVNVSQGEFPPELRHRATSLRLALGELGLDLEGEGRFTLLEGILAFLRRELEGPGESGGPGGVRQGLEERLYMRGEQVRFIAGPADSGQVLEGRLLGIGGGGELLILPKGGGGPRAFVSGELELPRQDPR
jgi:BirA family biotin operon repressor/biotin-[acetyl-CoA-carboxylase] ligase